MGSGVRASHQMKAAIAVIDPTSDAMMKGESHPSLLALLRPKRNSSSAAAEREAPSQSKEKPPLFRAALANLLSSSIDMAHAAPTMPTGTFMKNTARQSRASMRKPPSTGPDMLPTPTDMLFRLRATPRWLAPKTETMMAMDVAWIIADPRP
jgi:hypothetical protein